VRRDFGSPAVWLGGERLLESQLATLAEDGMLPTTPIESVGGRSRDHARLSLPEGDALFLKRFPRNASRRPWRDAILARLGASPAEREWRALARAHPAGAAVPEPRGVWRTSAGDLVLATTFLDGRDLREALECGAKQRRALLVEVAAAVRRLHDTGAVHRDLHAGNVRITDRGPVLVDPTAWLPSRSRAARRRDWGELEHSLERSLSTTDRVRLRAAALGVSRPYDPRARAALRRLGRSAAIRRAVHMTSRTRRATIPGRRFAAAAIDGWLGLRDRSVPREEVVAALRAAEDGGEVLKADRRTRVVAVAVAGRRVIVKRVAGRGWLRPLADTIRGSAGRRAWIGAQGLAARNIGVAAPLAYLERRVFGCPVASALLLEDLRPARSADRSDAPAEEVAKALARMLVDLHRAGVHHGDLKASHVFLVAGACGLETRLIDLEGVRFRRRLSDAERIRALSELNASLPDAFSNALRNRVYRSYAAVLPFREGSAAVRERIVERSLARRHRWSGGDQAGVRIAQRK
jgi:tRNA A-37 threonylcarbamoyl transferase component Bud32